MGRVAALLFALSLIPAVVSAEERLYGGIAADLVRESIRVVENGDIAAARDLLDRADRINPGNAEVNWHLARLDSNDQSMTIPVLERLQRVLDDSGSLWSVSRQEVEIAYLKTLLRLGRTDEVLAFYESIASTNRAARYWYFDARLRKEPDWAVVAELDTYRHELNSLTADQLYFERGSIPTLELLAWISNNNSVHSGDDSDAFLEIVLQSIRLFPAPVRDTLIDVYYAHGGTDLYPYALVSGDVTVPWYEYLNVETELRAEVLQELMKSKNEPVQAFLESWLHFHDSIPYDSDGDGFHEALLTLADGMPRFWTSDRDTDGRNELGVFPGPESYVGVFDEESVIALQYAPYPFVRKIFQLGSDGLQIATFREIRTVELPVLAPMLTDTTADLGNWLGFVPDSAQQRLTEQRVREFFSIHSTFLVLTTDDTELHLLRDAGIVR